MKFNQIHIKIALCCVFIHSMTFSAEIKLAVPFPESTKEWKVIDTAISKIAVDTDNRVLLKTLPPKLNEAITDRITKGELDGGLVVSSQTHLLDISPDAKAYNLPMLFKTARQVDYVRNRLDSEILASASRGAYEAIAFSEFGFAYMMSSQSIATPEDWQERKIWVPTESNFLNSIKLLNLNTVPVRSDEVSKKLKSGDIDALITPLSGAILKGWHRWIKQIYDQPYMYTYGMWVFKDSSLKGVADADKKIIMKYLGTPLSRSTRKRSAAARNVLTRFRINFVAQEDNSAMQKQMEKWRSLARENISRQDKPSRLILDKLDRLLEDF